MKKNTVMESQALKVQRFGVGSYGNNVYSAQYFAPARAWGRDPGRRF
jgi:hypothetical protein